jgi:hypothetical protein
MTATTATATTAVTNRVIDFIGVSFPPESDQIRSMMIASSA